jgi:hypothetical protein
MTFSKSGLLEPDLLGLSKPSVNKAQAIDHMHERGAFFSPGLRGRRDLEGQKREENVRNFPKTAFLTSLDSPDGMFWETNNSIGLG